ncbi:MAG TPA: hypothetical protein VIP48_08225 [Streptosporangiaceae bacterium]
MAADGGYLIARGPEPARALLRAGRWDDALAALPTDGPPTDGLRADGLRADELAGRAQILIDRFWWRLDDPAAAESAVAALRAADPVLGQFCAAQLAYTRLLFTIDPQPGHPDLARDGFSAGSADERIAGWGMFWLGVLADNVDHSPAAAVASYQHALTWARDQGDPILESYAVRHLGDHALRAGDAGGLDLVRRSYQLRAALGARPLTAAAAVTLAAELPPGAEANQLRETAWLTATELQLTWLLRAL